MGIKHFFLKLLFIITLFIRNSTADTTILNVNKNDSLFLSDTLRVKAQKIGGIRDNTIATNTVTGESINKTPRATYLEALSQATSAVYITSRGVGLHGISSGASGGIYIRGLGGSPNSQILVVEDGIPDFQGIFGHPIPDAFFPSLIEKVLIIKGGDGVLYGTNAMGGVIVIENKWSEKEGIEVENESTLGSFNTFRQSNVVLYKNSKLNLTSAFSAFTTDGHRKGADGKSNIATLKTKFNFTDYTNMSLQNKIIYLEAADPGPVIAPYTDHRFEVLRNNFSVSLNTIIKSIKFDLRLWLNYGNHRLYDGFFSNDYVGGIITETNINFFKYFTLIGGIETNLISGEVIDRTPDSAYVKPLIEALYQVAPYGQLSYKPNEKLNIVIGSRINYNTKYKGMSLLSNDTLPFEPLYKAGIGYVFLEHFEFIFNIARNFRQPTIKELYLPFPVASSSLKPEHSFNTNLGLRYKNEYSTISLNVYRTYAKDLIKYFGIWPSVEVVNIDEIDIPGCEVEIKISPLKNLIIYMTGCYQDVGRFTKQNPNLKVNGSLEYTNYNKLGQFESSVSYEWVSGLYMNNYKREPLRDIFFIDGSIRFNLQKLFKLYFEPYLIVRNLLNCKYEYIKYYPMPYVNLLGGIKIKI
ncbi:MAG: TonB-dependent receptor [Chitinispirillaceae bacterium]|nr:TonB-dependent receptor [Chitinispirillaceae bacterium]